MSDVFPLVVYGGPLPEDAETFLARECPIVGSYRAKDRWNRGVQVIPFLNTSSDNGCRPWQTRYPSRQSTLDNLAKGDLHTHVQDQSDAASLDQSASLSAA